MRSLLAGLWATSALLASTAAECQRVTPDELAAKVRCGDALDISNCLRTAGGNLIHPRCLVDDTCTGVLEFCLQSARCSDAQARFEVRRLARAGCGGGAADLRRRKVEPSKQKDPETTTQAHTTAQQVTSTNADTSVTDVATSTPAAPSTTAAPSTPAATSTTDTTTSSAAAAVTTKSTTAAQTTTLITSFSSSTVISSMASTGSSLDCFITSLSTYTWTVQSTNAAGSVVTSTIVTSTPISSCNPAFICQQSLQGNTTCMVRQDNLTTSGIVVSIIFGAIVVGFFVAIIAMCCRSNRPRRSQAPGHQASPLAETKAGAAASKPASGMRSTSDTHLPLMNAQGRASSAASTYSTEYVGASTYQTPAPSRQPSAGYPDARAAGQPPQLRLNVDGMDGYSQDVGYRHR